MKFRFTIKNRLALGFGAIMAGILVSFIMIMSIQERSRKITKRNLDVYSPSVEKLNNLQSLIGESKLMIKNWVFIEKLSDTKDKRNLVLLHSQRYGSIKKSLYTVSQYWIPDDTVLLTRIFQMIEDTLFALQENIMRQLNSFESYEDPMIMFTVMPMVGDDGEVTIASERIESSLLELQGHISKEASENNHKLISRLNSFKIFLILIIILLTGIAVSSSWITFKSIILPIKRLNKLIIRISQGYLYYDTHQIRQDEIGDMELTLEKMINTIKEIVDNIRSSSTTVASSSKALNSSSHDIATGANQQASSAEEVSASMEEMTSSIAQNSENSQHTEKIAKKVSDNVRLISEAVNDTADAMKNITERILVINDIAERIDLLAINAAIEAARAGEHGKGFAVVAGEVRNLAENSQRAANEIDSVSKTSVQVAEKSSKLLEDIIPDIQNTLKLVQEITATSMEQNTGISQINSAIQQLSSVTQENSAFAEELSLSSNKMLEQSEKLLESISFFKTTEEKEEDLNINEIKIQIAKLQKLLEKRKNGHPGESKNHKAEIKKDIISSGKTEEKINIDLNGETDEDYENFE